MKTLSTLLALTLLAPLGASAQVAPDPGAADAVVAVPPGALLLVDAIDIPLTPESVARAGLTEAHAVALATDVSARRYTRVRAVGALGVLGTVTARALIERLAVVDGDAFVRAQALVSLARVWGPSDREAVEGFLTERIDDPSPAVTDAIARELGRLYR